MSHTQLIISPRLKHKIDKYVRYVNIVSVFFTISLHYHNGIAWIETVTSCITDQCDDDDPSQIPPRVSPTDVMMMIPLGFPPRVSPTDVMMMIPLGFHPSVGFTTQGIRLLLLTDCTSIVANSLLKKSVNNTYCKSASTMVVCRNISVRIFCPNHD